MKVTQLRLAGQAAWPELLVDRFSPELNVFFGAPGGVKCAVAQLAAHLLYGKTGGGAGRQFSQTAPLAEGSVEVEGAAGKYLLRRHRDGTPQGRLSIASVEGAAVDNRTIPTLLSGLSPRLLAQLHAVDFAAPPQARTLLEGEFAREFTLAISRDGATYHPATACRQHAAGTSLQVDRGRVDELIRRRDKVALDIEKQLSASRQESGALERELQELDAALAARRKHAEDLHARLRVADAKLAETEAALRCFTLEPAVRRGPAVDEDRRQEQVEELDAEIARCRQMLADLQRRDAAVRRELAEVHPDGTADSVTCLADQRATIGVLERLLDDLDAEVAQLARSHEPGRCVGGDAHTRLTPVAQLLRQQLYTLCGQVTEQQRSVRRVQLRAESRQLSRAQTDLAEQLEHLLERRQSLAHEIQLAQRPVVFTPQAPAAALCQCHGHAEFVRAADAMQLAGAKRFPREEAARARRLDQQRQRDQLRAACDSLQQEIELLETRWQRLQQTRVQSASRSALDRLRAELERLESEIQTTLSGAMSTIAGRIAAAPHRQPWKASDALAQLTDGQLVQIRISRTGQGTTIVDRDGRILSVAELNAMQQDQLYLALTLALVSSFGSRGVDLPLFLDEPFLRQDERGAASMAGVLEEFARQGRQVIVFTGNAAAARRFESLGVEVRAFDLLRQQIDVAKAAAPAPIVVTPPSPVASPTTTVKIVREPLDQRKPQLRVAGEWSPAEDEHEGYFLTVKASIADFPVLGNDTAKVFTGFGIRTVEDLLAADGAEIATRLNRPGIQATTVRLWQSHMSLMCFVPGVSLNDAQVLAANEVISPEALFAIDVERLGQSIERFIGSERGRRFASMRDHFTRERLAELQKLARSQRERWQQVREKFGWVDRTHLVAPLVTARPASRRRKHPTKKAAKSVRRAEPPSLRFLLDRGSPAAAAPSVGPRAAEQLARVGIRTVADLLTANPQSTADELADGRLTADIITRWQSEARLACRIPELRNRGARLLVACGFMEPEQVAGANPAELTKTIRAFCKSSRGLRILRSGKAPSRERIARWVRHAAHMRPLEAA